MIKIKKLTGFIIFLLFEMIFISCGKPSKKDIIDKGYILEVGVVYPMRLTGNLPEKWSILPLILFSK